MVPCEFYENLVLKKLFQSTDAFVIDFIMLLLFLNKILFAWNKCDALRDLVPKA